MNSKILTQTFTVTPYAHKENSNSNTQSNVKQSVIHILIAPLTLALVSPSAGLLYFALAMVAYFTIFSDKNYYVKMILKTVAAFAVVGISWFGLIGFIGKVASIFTGAVL